MHTINKIQSFYATRTQPRAFTVMSIKLVLSFTILLLIIIEALSLKMCFRNIFEKEKTVFHLSPYCRCTALRAPCDTFFENRANLHSAFCLDTEWESNLCCCVNMASHMCLYYYIVVHPYQKKC